MFIRILSRRTTLMLMTILLVSCEHKTNISSGSHVLARVGDANITVEEFTSSYQAGSSLLKDADQPKRSFLNAMIHEELLAADLKQDSSFVKRQDIQKALKLLKQELLVERMFREEVYNKIEVSESEIQDAILQSSISLRTRYLISQDKDFALQCLEQLDSGVAFDSLLNDKSDMIAHVAFLDSTDYLKYGELDEEINDVLFNLKVQQYSDVIPLAGSYIILQNIASLQEVNSESDFNRYHDRFQKILTYRKRLAESRKFVKSFMDPLEIEVAGKSFVFLVNALYELYVNIPYEQRQLSRKQAENQELPFQSILNQLQEHAHDSAVRFKGGTLTIEELLEQVLLKPFHIEATDKNAFAKELNGDIAIALRDYFMEQKARQRGYDQDQKILTELDQWQEKLLVQDYLKDIRSQIHLDTTEIREQVGEQIPSSSARWKQAKQTLTNLGCKARLKHQTDSLRAITKIQINDDLLKSIDVDLPVHKQGMDVYFFKLGLPYLRSAFTTPDPIWSTK